VDAKQVAFTNVTRLHMNAPYDLDDSGQPEAAIASDGFAAIADSDVASANAQSGLRSGLPCPVDTPSPKAGFNERQSLGHWCLDCRFSYGS
jgi:hypothetical protein